MDLREMMNILAEILLGLQDRGFELAAPIRQDELDAVEANLGPLPSALKALALSTNGIFEATNYLITIWPAQSWYVMDGFLFFGDYLQRIWGYAVEINNTKERVLRIADDMVWVSESVVLFLKNLAENPEAVVNGLGTYEVALGVTLPQDCLEWSRGF